MVLPDVVPYTREQQKQLHDELQSLKCLPPHNENACLVPEIRAWIWDYIVMREQTRVGE